MANGNNDQRLAAAIAAALAPEFANLARGLDSVRQEVRVVGEGVHAVGEEVRLVTEGVRVLGEKVDRNTTVLLGRSGDADARLADHERRISELERRR